MKDRKRPKELTTLDLLQKLYRIQPKVLGSGSFGKVVLANSHLGLRAIKAI